MAVLNLVDIASSTISRNGQVEELDFARVIAQILAAGVSHATIANTLNVSFNTVKRWRNGAQPRWHHGMAILLMHKKFCELRNCATAEA